MKGLVVAIAVWICAQSLGCSGTCGDAAELRDPRADIAAKYTDPPAAKGSGPAAKSSHQDDEPPERKARLLRLVLSTEAQANNPATKRDALEVLVVGHLELRMSGEMDEAALKTVQDALASMSDDQLEKMVAHVSAEEVAVAVPASEIKLRRVVNCSDEVHGASKKWASENGLSLLKDHNAYGVVRVHADLPDEHGYFEVLYRFRPESLTTLDFLYIYKGWDEISPQNVSSLRERHGINDVCRALSRAVTCPAPD